ncbi:MAG: hypothetical protein P8P29_01115 [Flavobacteriaceae bacterium]|nr:hypothetical protein [Flavobacteriaceae bacterium]
MDKKLIQQLLDDDETRAQISIPFGLAVDADDGRVYDCLMINVLNKLNATLVEGDMITIKVSEYMWVRGKYVRTIDDGRVEVFPAFGKPYTGKRVDLVVKGEEGEADV